jgi:hypothetical protein
MNVNNGTKRLFSNALENHPEMRCWGYSDKGTKLLLLRKRDSGRLRDGEGEM